MEEKYIKGLFLKYIEDSLLDEYKSVGITHKNKSNEFNSTFTLYNLIILKLVIQ